MIIYDYLQLFRVFKIIVNNTVRFFGQNNIIRYEIRDGVPIFHLGLEQDCTPVLSKFKLILGAQKAY